MTNDIDLTPAGIAARKATTATADHARLAKMLAGPTDAELETLFRTFRATPAERAAIIALMRNPAAARVTIVREEPAHLSDPAVLERVLARRILRNAERKLNF